jgi:hypothetical protein
MPGGSPRLDEEATETVVDTETDLVAIVEKTVDAYNTKNWGRYALSFREDMRYCHHNRGFEFSDRATFLAAMRVFASDLIPNRTLGPAVRCVQSGDTVVREQVWSGKAVADFPGIASAGEDFRLEVCTVYVFDGDLIVEYHEYG